MNTDKNVPIKLKEQFTHYMDEHKLRKTMERYTILEHICKVKNHFDIEMVHSSLSNENFYVSRASIYNTIELLREAKIIVRHQFTTQIALYELRLYADTHHHAICNYCGAIKEFKNEKLSKDILTVQMPKFTHEYHSIYIYGICSKCKFRLTKETKKKQQ